MCIYLSISQSSCGVFSPTTALKPKETKPDRKSIIGLMLSGSQCHWSLSLPPNTHTHHCSGDTTWQCQASHSAWSMREHCSVPQLETCHCFLGLLPIFLHNFPGSKLALCRLSCAWQWTWVLWDLQQQTVPWQCLGFSMFLFPLYFLRSLHRCPPLGYELLVGPDCFIYPLIQNV